MKTPQKDVFEYSIKTIVDGWYFFFSLSQMIIGILNMNY
jgi:hypothetical protein